MRRSITALFSAIAIALGLGLAACGSPSSAVGEPVEIGQNTILLDVRTPGEFQEGHLEGAQLLDFSSGELATALPGLDPDAEYLVYCRSGNRSGQAIALMEQAGFTNLTDLGSIEQAAAATELSITR